MKIVLNREEVKALRELANIMDSIQGSPVKKYLEDFKISKKAYLVSMITGELTIETTPEMVTELLSIIKDFATEVSPFVTALVGLYKAMMPACDRYDVKFSEFFNKYREDEPKINWELQSVTTEVANINEIKEVI